LSSIEENTVIRLSSFGTGFTFRLKYFILKLVSADSFNAYIFAILLIQFPHFSLASWKNVAGLVWYLVKPLLWWEPAWRARLRGGAGARSYAWVLSLQHSLGANAVAVELSRDW